MRNISFKFVEIDISVCIEPFSVSPMFIEPLNNMVVVDCIIVFSSASFKFTILNDPCVDG